MLIWLLEFSFLSLRKRIESKYLVKVRDIGKIYIKEKKLENDYIYKCE